MRAVDIRILALAMLLSTPMVATGQTADEDVVDILAWVEEVQEIAGKAKIPCPKTPPIPIFYQEPGVEGLSLRYGAGQLKSKLVDKDCPPNEPPIPIFFRDPEAVRGSIEDFRIGLEAFRDQIELLRESGDISTAVYQDAIPSYQRGMSIYRNSISEYHAVIELKKEQISLEVQEQ